LVELINDGSFHLNIPRIVTDFWVELNIEALIPHILQYTSENNCFLTVLASAEIYKTGTGPERAQAIDGWREGKTKRKSV